MTSDVCVTDETKQNPTPSQKELIRWHVILGHIGFQHVQWLISTGRLKLQGNSKAVANYESPKCAACEFGKVHSQPNKVNTNKRNIMKEKELKKDHLLPGQMVYADHYISRDPGRLYHTKGKSDPSDMFSGGCVFIDNASGYVSIKHHVAINATETVREKLTFEREAQSQGVVIKGYYTDNGILNASEFMEELLKKQKNIRFSGAGTSHKNGASERAIKTVVTMTRTTLMHAALRCPEYTLYTDIWPMAMYYDVWVYSWTPDMKSGLYAIEIWSR